MDNNESPKPQPKPQPMRQLDKRPQVGRRGFLRGSGWAAIGVTAAPVVTLTVAPLEVYAQSYTTLGADIGQTLIRMARDIFPHDKLPDSLYAQAVAPYDAAAAKDAALKTLIENGVKALNAQAQKRYGKPYGDVATEAERVLVLKDIEPSPFFQKIKGDLVTGLYDNKAVWPLLGYEGASVEKGGYLHRGFNDIDWL